MEFREKPFQPTETPRTPEAGNENVPDPETARLLGALERYVNREFREREQMSFSDELDEIEIINALYELRNKHSSGFHDFGSMSLADEERQAVLAYHNNLAERQKLGEATPEKTSEKNLQEFLQDISALQKMSGNIESDWGTSFFAFLRQREMKENRYIRIEEEFGGTNISRIKQFFESPEEARTELLQQYPELTEAYKRFYIGQYPNLQKRLQETEQALDDRTREHPEEIRNLLAQLHGSDDQMDSVAIDDLIGIKPEQVERDVDMRGLEQQYGHEQFTYQGTSYELIRQFLKELNLTDQDVLYDLGCGYGRIPLYGAMTTPGKYRGIEIVPERVVEANTVKDKLKLDNVDFRQGNVLEQDYSDGSVFFLFNPFAIETLEKAGEQLEQLAKTKKIRVVSVGPSTSYFNSQQWLRPVDSGSKERPWGLTIYESL